MSSSRSRQRRQAVGRRAAGQLGSRAAGQQGSRAAGQQGSRAEQGSRSSRAAQQGSWAAEQQGSRAAGQQGSRTAGQQGSRAAGQQGSRSAEQQGSRAEDRRGQTDRQDRQAGRQAKSSEGLAGMPEVSFMDKGWVAARSNRYVESRFYRLRLGRSKLEQLCRKLVLSTKAGSQDSTEDIR